MSTHVPPRRDQEQKQDKGGPQPVPEAQPTAPTATAAPPRAITAPAPAVSLTAGRLPDWAPWAAILGSAAATAAILAVIGFKVALMLIFTAIISGIVIYTWSRAVEGRRAATDRGVTVLVTVAFLVAVAPLISLLYTVFDRGLARFDSDFFTISMRGVVGAGGGAYHAILGTLIITGLATVISVMHSCRYGHTFR